MSARLGRSAVVLGALAVLLVVLAVLGVATGPSGIDVGAAVSAFAGVPTGTSAVVVLEIRLPRVVTGLVAGSLLGVAGTVFQTTTRNRLADPSTLGVAPAAAAAVTTTLALAGPSGALGTTVAAGAGAMAGAVLLLVIGALTDGSSHRLVLLGLAVAASCNALTAVMLVVAGSGAQSALVWLTGSLARTDLASASALVPVAIALVVLVGAGARRLDLLALDDGAAGGLGLNTARTRSAAVIVGAAATGGAVAVAGAMTFVGLLAPHLARIALGRGDHASLVPAAGLCGAAVVLLADLLGRVVLAPTEVAAGVVVVLLGAPLFLALLRRQPWSA